MMKKLIKSTLVLFTILILITLICPVSFSKSIIVDHTCRDISQIPDYWLEQAKLLTIHYAHTSHGSQINSGILNLESQDSNYSIAIRTSTTAGLPPEEYPPALRMYDGNPPETYITPEDYWDGESGKDRTRAVAGTGDYDFSMWSWCGQVSGATDIYIQSYLDTLHQFETEYPDMRFIYMTGHLDGGGSAGNLHIRNEQIRDYCISNNKVLFDFADIERYDPDGTDFLDLGADDNCDYSGGNWAQEWCAAHPGSDLCASCSCAHSQALNCNLKARAFWWMMARLAGWNPRGDELAVDFNANGLWHYDGTDWNQLNGQDPEGMEEWDGGLAADFGASGLWNYDGSSWGLLTSNNAEGMEAWDSGLAVDFGGTGLWSYNGSSWDLLTTNDPQGIESWTNGLAVDFGSTGLWNYDGSLWSLLTTNDAQGMTAWSDGLAVDFDTFGLWNYDGSSWGQLTSNNAESMESWSNGLAVDFDTFGLWNYDGLSWGLLTTNNAEFMAAWDSGLAVDFGAFGLWSCSGSSWDLLTTSNAQDLSGWATSIAVDLGTGGLWNYDGSAWSLLTTWDANEMIDVNFY